MSNMLASPVPTRKAMKKLIGLSSGQNIKVFVRVRPLDNNEKNSKAHTLVECPTSKEIVVQERPFDKFTKKFMFDKVFDHKSKQTDIYKSVAKPLVEEVLNGFNCTIFAYGQTGTGKTFTMEGDHASDGISLEDNSSAGIIPRCVNHLFDELRVQKSEFTMRVSFLELYNEELFDLLSAHDDLSKLRIYEDSNRKGSCIIQGLEEVLVRCKSDVYNIIEKGSAKRQTAATLMNAHSSRSHTVFTVTVHIKENTLEGDELLKTGKLHLVDLAGSENIGRSGAVDKRAREAGNINQSLLTLGRVITSLVEKTPHIPYRESKLTRLLQDALGGRTKTSIIATVSPASTNLEETLSTLDYAHRAKNIQNKPEVNQKLNKKELIGEYTVEIEKLRRDLLAMREKNGVYLANENYQELVDTMEQQAQEISEKIAHIRALEEDFEKQCENFNQVSQELEGANVKLLETEEKLLTAKETLSCTQKLLHQTAVERDEQKYLVANRSKTEVKLHSQGNDLITVADITTSDIQKLHDKLDRKRNVEMKNSKYESSFAKDYQKYLDMVCSNISEFKTLRKQNSTNIFNRFDTCMDCSNKEFARLSLQLERLSVYVNEAYKNINKLVDNKLEENEVSVLTVIDSIEEVTKREEENVRKFREENFAPTMHEVTQLLKTQAQSIAKLQEVIQLKMSEMSEFCLSVSENENTLLSKMESHISEMIQFYTSQSNELQLKTKAIEDQNNSHSNILKNHLRQALAEIENYEKVVSLQVPVLVAEQEKSLKYTQESSEQLLNYIGSLNSASSEHKEKVVKGNAENEMVLMDGVAETMNQLEELRMQCNHIDSVVDNQTTGTSEALKKTCKISHDGKEKYLKTIRESRILLKEEIKCKSEDLQHQLNTEEAYLKKEGDTISMYMHELQENYSTNDSYLERFLNDHNAELKDCGNMVHDFLTKQLTKDEPTGLTPTRREYTYPQTLAATSPHEKLLERYRIMVNYASKIPLPKYPQDFEDEVTSSLESSRAFSTDSSISSECDKSMNTGSVTDLVHSSQGVGSKDVSSGFLLPAVPLYYQDKQPEESKSGSLSRSSSSSSIPDSKENIDGHALRRTNSKSRIPSSKTNNNAEKAIPDTYTQTRTRKILGSYNN